MYIQGLPLLQMRSFCYGKTSYNCKGRGKRQLKGTLSAICKLDSLHTSMSYHHPILGRGDLKTMN